MDLGLMLKQKTQKNFTEIFLCIHHHLTNLMECDYLCSPCTSVLVYLSCSAVLPQLEVGDVSPSILLSPQ